MKRPSATTSTAAAAENTNANTLEITNTKFGVKGEVVQPEPSKNQGVLIGGETVRFTGAGYTVESSADKKAMTVSYADVAGNGYATLTGDVSAVIGSNNTLTFKVTNNGTETAVVKITIKNDASAANAALKATVNGAAAEVVGGEVTVRIAAGESAELVIVIDTAVSPDKFVVSLNSFEETNAATGDITIRELAAKKAE